MEEDSYSDSSAPSTSPEGEGKPESEGQGDDDTKTGMLDSALFPKDCKPGDKYTIEVIAVYGDSKEVKVLGPEEPDSGNETETAMAGKRMGDYATEG